MHRAISTLNNETTNVLSPEYTKPKSVVTAIVNRNRELWEEQDTRELGEKIIQWAREIRDGKDSSQGLLRLSENEVPPHVSVIIPAYNEEKYLLQLLQAIAAQNYTRGVEVIVVDNNSDPNDLTSWIAEQCGARVIKYNIADNNQNKKLAQIAVARNVGLQKARGEIVVSTDADTVFGRNWLNTLIEPLDEDTKVTCTTCIAQHYDTDVYPQAHVANVAFRLRRVVAPIYGQTEFKDSFGTTSGANMAFRKSDAVELGGYDERVYPGEDSYLGNQLKTIGKIRHIQDPEAIAYVSPRRFKALATKGIVSALVKSREKYFDEDTRRPVSIR